MKILKIISTEVMQLASTLIQAEMQLVDILPVKEMRTGMK